MRLDKKCLSNYLLSSILVFGCACGPSGGSRSTEKPISRKYTEVDLKKIIILGMTEEGLINNIGLPSSTVQVSSNINILTYNCPFDVNKEGNYLTGFVVHIRNGKVFHWSPVTGMVGPVMFQDSGGPQASWGAQRFKIFLLTDKLKHIYGKFESEESADVGNLEISPDMVFQAIMLVETSGGISSGRKSVTLVMADRDSTRLKDLTENHIGGRLLFVCRNKVFAAPVITEPIAAKQVIITVKEKSIKSIELQGGTSRNSAKR